MNSRRAREIQREIGRILLSEWDPIGVAEIPEAKEEYSGYVGVVYRLLSSGSSAIEIAEQLRAIEIDRMGLTARSLDVLVPVCPGERGESVVPDGVDDVAARTGTARRIETVAMLPLLAPGAPQQSQKSSGPEYAGLEFHEGVPATGTAGCRSTREVARSATRCDAPGWPRR